MGLLTTSPQKTNFYYTNTNGNTLPAFNVDCVLSETPTFSNTVTTNPLETGESAADHVTFEPITLDVSFIITNTPLSIGQSLIASGIGAIGNISSSIVAKAAEVLAINKLSSLTDDTSYNVVNMWQLIEGFRISATPIHVFTAVRNYINMAITRVSFTRDIDHIQSIVVAMSLQELLFESTQSTTVSNTTTDSTTNSTAKKTTNQGTKTAAKADTSTAAKAGTKKSWLLSMYD